MTDPDRPERLSQQENARWLAELFVNSSVDESGDLAHQIVDRRRARQAAQNITARR